MKSGGAGTTANLSNHDIFENASQVNLKTDMCSRDGEKQEHPGPRCPAAPGIEHIISVKHAPQPLQQMSMEGLDISWYVL